MNPRDTLITKLKQIGLGRIAPAVADQGRPCFHLQTAKAADGDMRVAASKLGGLPDLPPDRSWPVADGKPLAFVAQINLAELPEESLLPKEGLLSFFFDSEQGAWGFAPKHREYGQVIFTASLQQVRRSANPLEPTKQGLAMRFTSFLRRGDSRCIFDSLRLSFVPYLSIPAGNVQAIHDALIAEDENEAGEDAYHDFRETYPVKGPKHQLLGWPTPIQDEMELECQLVSNGLYVGDATGFQDPRAEALRSGASDWILLLQIDTDDDAGMMWGDGGMLYFWVRRQDLEQRAFDRAWFILQCF